MRKKRLIALVLFVIILAFPALAEMGVDEDEDGYCSYIVDTCPAGLSCEDPCPEDFDCNDNDPMIYPGAEEELNELDDDCNGIVDDRDILCADSDLDGYEVPVDAGTIDDCGGEGFIDCNDVSAFINPGASEICDNSKDDDCDGLVDSNDPNCIEEGEPEGEECTLIEDYTGWFGCDTFPGKVNELNKGDTAFLVLWSDNCHDNSQVTFEIYEYNDESEPALVDTVDGDFYQYNENGEDSTIYFGVYPWIVEYLIDDDETDPEYFFKAKLVEPGNDEYEIDSGQSTSTLLTVHACPEDNPECGEECVGFPDSFNPDQEEEVVCQPTDLDCTPAAWSDCSPVTNKKTRDISKCIIEGVDEECEQQVRDLLATEQGCLPETRPSTDTLVTGPESYCGDDICDEDEDYGSCPDDCEEPSGIGWWIFIILVLVAIMVGGIIYMVKRKMAAKGEEEPKDKKKKPEGELFANQKDLDSIIYYITSARKKGYKDEQINLMLGKGGWKPNQIKHAFSKVPKAEKTVSPFKDKSDEKSVLDYVKKAKQQGYKDGQIKQALLKSGRDAKQADYALKQ